MQNQDKPKTLTLERKRELLMQIATGEIQSSVVVKDKEGHSSILQVDPDIADRLRAIDMDNRMTGEDRQLSQPQFTGYRIFIGEQEFK